MICAGVSEYNIERFIMFGNNISNEDQSSHFKVRSQRQVTVPKSRSISKDII